METYIESIEYKALAEEIIAKHQEFQHIKDSAVNICYMVSDKKKKSQGMIVHGDCEKVKPKQRNLMPYDFIITIYEKNCITMTEEQMYLLMYHELMHIGCERKEDGTLKTWIVPHDLQDFHRIADVYGTWWSEEGMIIEPERLE